MNLARFRFGDGRKASVGGALSQSLDAGDTSEPGSFEEVKVKRTSSAPSRDGSATPPPTTTNQPSTSSKNPIFAITTASMAGTPLRPHYLPVHLETELDRKSTAPHVCVDLEDEGVGGGRKSSPSRDPPQPIRPNGSNTAILGSKLQGIVQPIKSSATPSGWL